MSCGCLTMCAGDSDPGLALHQSAKKIGPFVDRDTLFQGGVISGLDRAMADD